MLKKVMLMAALAAFISGPIVAPAFAAGDAKKCEAIKDAKKKAACLKAAKGKK